MRSGVIQSIVLVLGTTSEQDECRRFFSREGAAWSSGNSKIVTRTIVVRQTSARKWQLRSDRNIIRRRRPRTFVLIHVHAYRTVITPQITTDRSDVGDTRRRGRKGRDLECWNRKKRLGCSMYERGVAEIDEGE